MDMADRRNVYIVDDDEEVRSELSEALEMRGFAVLAYADGTRFLSAQAALPAGCVVLDLNMPGMGGMDVQQALIAQGALHKIVMLTGAGSVSTAVKAMHAGATDFLEKPFHVDDLVRAIGSAVNRQVREVEEESRRRQAEAHIARLSDRERDVLCGMALGLAACGHNVEQRAATGAAAGLIVGGPVGAAVGAGVGVVVSKAADN